MINKTRLINEFIGLVKIDSLTFDERKMADKLIHILEGEGYLPKEDDTAHKIGGNAGNIICKISGAAEAPPIMLMAHMDTVVPGLSKNPVIEGDIIKSDGKTILGGDDIAGVACILEAIRVIKEQKIKHGDIYVVFTVSEEGGLWGAKNLDYSLIPAKYAFILDDEGSIGTAAIKAPFYNKLEITVNGKAAHAGLEPEKGINAIQIAAKAINDINFWGRIDDTTTCNLGIIEGGRARNIVCDKVEIKAECRSIDKDKMNLYTDKIIASFKAAAEFFKTDIDYNIEQMYPGYAISKTSEIIKIFDNACKNIGLCTNLHYTGGGSDTNIVNSKGIQAIDMSVGMEKVHSTEEQIRISDMMKATELLIEIIKVVVFLN